jgi:O-methyltransferase involved in polyketide biosynthesis
MNKQKVTIELGAVQETLILPLRARARETKKKNPIIRDNYAKDLVDRIDYDFSNLETNRELAENQQIQWAIRAYNFDNIVKEFLAHNSNSVVINIGAGLDTAFQRVDNGDVVWINIDLPDVVSLRQKLIPDSKRETTIARSVFDFNWIDDIAALTKDRPILFMAAGVLFYFSPSEVESLFRKLADAYPSAHFIFDAVTSHWILWLTNWAIMRKSGMDASVRLKWYLRKALDLKQYAGTIKVIEEYSMFSNVPSTEGWSKKMLRDLKIGNLLHVYDMVHVQF